MIDKGPHDIPNVLQRGPLVDSFEDSNMSDFAQICKQSVAHGYFILIITAIYNWMMWKRALTTLGFSMRIHPRIKVGFVKAVESFTETNVFGK